MTRLPIIPEFTALVQCVFRSELMPGTSIGNHLQRYQLKRNSKETPNPNPPLHQSHLHLSPRLSESLHYLHSLHPSS